MVSTRFRLDWPMIRLPIKLKQFDLIAELTLLNMARIWLSFCGWVSLCVCLCVFEVTGANIPLKTIGDGSSIDFRITVASSFSRFSFIVGGKKWLAALCFHSDIVNGANHVLITSSNQVSIRRL